MKTGRLNLQSSSRKASTVPSMTPDCTASPVAMDCTNEAVGHALAEGVGRGVDGVGVNLVVVTRQPGEGHDVGLGNRPAGRAQPRADAEVLKIQSFGLVDKLSHVSFIQNNINVM